MPTIVFEGISVLVECEVRPRTREAAQALDRYPEALLQMQAALRSVLTLTDGDVATRAHRLAKN